MRRRRPSEDPDLRRTTPGDPGAAAGELTVAVLGPLELGTSGGEALPLGGSKQRALLALLVLHRNRPVESSRLVQGLWGDAAPRGAEATLRSHVSHLRRHLAGVAGGDVLTTGPAGYRLALAPGQVDVDRFERLVGLGQEALGLDRPRRASTHVREALGLWRGRPFGELEALVAAHPFRERFGAQLMVALYRSGRQADALDVYARARERLADELGLDPGPELQELGSRVLRQDPVLLGDAELPAAPSRGTRRSPTSPPDGVFAAMAELPLVGRAAEADRLAAAWEAVVHGSRRLVLLSGEAGIGKTHLLAALVARASGAGHTVLVGRCAAAARPYEPVTDALGDRPDVHEALDGAPEAVLSALAPLLERSDGTAGESGEPPRAEEEPALHAAVTVVFRLLARAGPVLLVLENAEQLDRASSLLLRHLVARLPAGLLFVLCFRDPPGARHPPLAELLGDAAARDGAERIALGPLDEAELADVVRGILPDIDRFAGPLRRHTGGNPFFAQEMVRVIAAAGRAGDPRSWEVPVGVRDVVRHRLHALSETAREVLPVAAVLGAEVDFELLAQVVRLPEDEVESALEDAVSAGLLVESGRSWAGRYSFPHELMRDALRSHVTGLRLRALHLQAAQALTSRARPGPRNSAVIAGHLLAAGAAADPAEAARFSLQAAEEARAVYAWDEAVDHAEAAVRLLADTAAPNEVDAVLTAASMRLQSGRDLARAVALLESALRAHARAGDDAAAGLVHGWLGAALCMHHSTMDVPRALEHLAAAERLLPSPKSAHHLHRGRAQAAMFGLRTHLLAESTERAESIAAERGRRDLVAVTGWARGWAHLNLGHLTDATAAWERAWGLAHELADPFLGWMPVNAAALAANAFLLDPAAARAWCRRGLGQSHFASFTQPHGAVVDQLALALAAMGEMDPAHEAVESLPADAVARRVLTHLAGGWEVAEGAWAAAAAADESAGNLHDAALNLRWASEARVVLGDDGGAAEALTRALVLGREGPQVPTELAAGAELARLHALERPGEAEAHLARCEEILAGGEDWRGLLGVVDLAAAAVAAARGDDEGADTASGRAVEVFTRYRLPWRRAAALEAWAVLLGRRGAHEEAAERRHQAQEVYARVGAADRWRRRVTAP